MDAMEQTKCQKCRLTIRPTQIHAQGVYTAHQLRVIDEALLQA